jgi:peptide/nickel transport system permease protein
VKKYLLKRLLRLIPVFLGVTILAFLLTGLSSVDAVDLKESSSGGVMSEAEKEALREELGLNEPKAVQYLQWLKNALRGDFGESYVSGKPVLVSFCEKLPATIALAALALAMTVCFSFPLGILSAKYQNMWADRSISLFCFAGNSFPGFFTALLLLYFFSLKWNLFPVLSMGKGWKSCVLPAATLAVSMTAKYTRQVRSAVLAELEQEYVAGARARGLSENRILFGNILKSVLLRMVTLLFLSAGSLLGGTAIVETIFMWNGVGKMAVDAVSMHDIPVIQAYLVWMAAIYLLLHLIADLLMGALDPRAKLEGMR